MISNAKVPMPGSNCGLLRPRKRALYEIAGKNDEDDPITNAKIEPGKLHFDPMLEGQAPVVLALPKSVGAKAKTGWSATLELARVRGRWRIPSTEAVCP